MANQSELRQNITHQIVDALKSGSVPMWRRPWTLSDNTGFPANLVSKKAYRGINILLLEMRSMRHGFGIGVAPPETGV